MTTTIDERLVDPTDPIHTQLEATLEEQDQDYIQRAIRAYSRRCKTEGVLYEQPANTSEVIHGRPSYVELRNGNGLLATYRLVGHAFRGASLKWVEPGQRKFESSL